jgi:YbbR-like protein
MMKNIGLKVFALLLAIVLSYVVNSERNTSIINVSIPVEIQNIPPEKVLLSPPRRDLQVTIRGPSFIAGSIAGSPPVARVLIPESVGRRFRASFTARDLAFPAGIETLGIDPPEFDLLFDDRLVKNVRVEIPRIGQIGEDYQIEGISAQPGTVTVSGPDTEVRGVTVVETSPVDLREITTTKEIELAIRPPGNLSAVSPRRVDVRIEVRERIREKSFAGCPVKIIGDHSGEWRVVPPLVDVVTAAPALRTARLAPTEIVVSVPRPTGEGPAKGIDLEPVVDLPQGVTLARIEPRTVRLERVAGPTVIPKGKRSSK